MQIVRDTRTIAFVQFEVICSHVDCEFYTKGCSVTLISSDYHNAAATPIKN